MSGYLSRKGGGCDDTGTVVEDGEETLRGEACVPGGERENDGGVGAGSGRCGDGCGCYAFQVSGVWVEHNSAEEVGMTNDSKWAWIDSVYEEEYLENFIAVNWCLWVGAENAALCMYNFA